MNQKITKGKGFKTPKKLKINWDAVGMGILMALAAAVVIFAIPYSVRFPQSANVQLTPPVGDPGQVDSQTPVPGSSAPDGLIWEDDLFLITDEEGNIIPSLPLPLPPIGLQQVYYDPMTGKLWFLDDDLAPHEIILKVTIGDMLTLRDANCPHGRD